MDDVPAALQRIELFSGLSATDLGRVQAVIEHLDRPAGGELFAEGDPPDGVYVLVEGTVRIAKGRGLTPGQYGRFLATLAPGDLFGELALVLNEPRTAAAVAVGPVRLMRISCASFETLSAGRDELAFTLHRNLARSLASRLRGVSEGLVGRRPAV